MGQHESSTRNTAQSDTGNTHEPRHTLVGMDIPLRSVEERLAELDSLDLTPDERALAEGYIEQSEEALEWAEAALEIMPPIDDGGYPDEYFEQTKPKGPSTDAE